jgi:hypothetical protein
MGLRDEGSAMMRLSKPENAPASKWVVVIGIPRTWAALVACRPVVVLSVGQADAGSLAGELLGC